MKKFIKLNVKDINNYSRVDNYLSVKLDDFSRNRINSFHRNSMTENLSIIGGGIAGLMLGCVAKINGRHCKIYEKSESLSVHGAGISLSPNTTKIFKEIGILENLLEESCMPIDLSLIHI